MGDSATTPVIAGLTIGVAFVVMFSLVIMPVTALTDEEIIENTKGLKEVQFFLEMHPDADIHVERNDAPSGIDVYYSVEKQIYEPIGFDSGSRTKELVIRVDSSGNPAGIMLACGAGRTVVMFHVTTDMIANECFVEPHNSSVAISFVKSRGFGDCFFNCTHTHTIFIYDNGTGIHKEGSAYYLFQAPQQSIRDIIDQVYSLERKPEISNETDPDDTVIDVYCNDFFIDSSVSIIANGETEKTLCYPGVPELRELEEKIEQIRQQYDDGVVDCTLDKRNCPVYIPRDLVPKSTGLFEIEPETDVGEPIPVEILSDNETSIEITYTED